MMILLTTAARINNNNEIASHSDSLGNAVAANMIMIMFKNFDEHITMQ
jgi:hypothetical protein